MDLPAATPTPLINPAQRRSRARLSLAVAGRSPSLTLCRACLRAHALGSLGSVAWELGVFVWSAVMAVRFVPPRRAFVVFVTQPHAHVRLPASQR